MIDVEQAELVLSVKFGTDLTEHGDFEQRMETIVAVANGCAEAVANLEGTIDAYVVKTKEARMLT